MPLQTEALAVINELPKGDPAQREAQVRGYAHLLAGQSLSDYPADDETVTTLAWVQSIGGTVADPSLFDIPSEADATIGFTTADAVTTPTITAPVAETVELPATSTRGAVRRLLDALGVSYS